MAGFLLAPCRNVHPVEMYRQGKQDADMRVRKNTVGYVWRGKWIIRVCLHLCWRWHELLRLLLQELWWEHREEWIFSGSAFLAW